MHPSSAVDLPETRDPYLGPVELDGSSAEPLRASSSALRCPSRHTRKTTSRRPPQASSVQYQPGSQRLRERESRRTSIDGAARDLHTYLPTSRRRPSPRNTGEAVHLVSRHRSGVVAVLPASKLFGPGEIDMAAQFARL